MRMTLFRLPTIRASVTLLSSLKQVSNIPTTTSSSAGAVSPITSYTLPPEGALRSSLFRSYFAMTVDTPKFHTTKCSQNPAPHSNFVKIVEVGPRDGLQNEKTIVPTKTKLALIEKLSLTGLSVIEAGAFVSPKWVPQMADTPQILQYLDKHPAGAAKSEGITYPYLVPNLQGLERALGLGTTNLKEVAIFASASEGFSQKNINCSIDESLERFRPVLELCHDRGIRVRGYISMIFSCPYDGPTPPTRVAEVTKMLLDMGCYEVSLGDTNGTGTPPLTSVLLTTLLSKPYSIPVSKLACHFHDTYNAALVNAMTALYLGVRVFDSSVAGLGGCPYSKGATGNVSTEDLIYFLHGMGVETGVDLEGVSRVGEWISRELGRANGSKVGPTLLTRLRAEEERKEKEKDAKL